MVGARLAGMLDGLLGRSLWTGLPPSEQLAAARTEAITATAFMGLS
jgi:hypothetical protein